MKALLICPGERKNVAALTESAPLAVLPIVGKSLLEYWLEHLATLGAKEVLVLATDRPEQVRETVGNGERWGLRVSVLPERRELTPAEALKKFAAGSDGGWLSAPDGARVMDYLPALPNHPLFTSYADWYAAVRDWLPRAVTPDRLGVREIEPGIVAGLHARLASGVELRPPCWLGQNVQVGPGAVLGPGTILENNTVVEAGARITRSVVGPETFVGKFTEIRDSLAWGSLLASWRLDSCLRVQDSFLLSSLRRRDAAFAPPGVLGRVAALLAMLLTSPLALAFMVKAKLQGRVALRPRLAVRPGLRDAAAIPGGRLTYYELNGPRGWLQRWPQLWKIVRGNFSWIGNRPLAPEQAAGLANEFERLWLAAPLGLISLADVEGCREPHGVEARAHASYYAAHAHPRLNRALLVRAVFLLLFGIPCSQARERLAQALAAAGTEADLAR